VISPDKAAIPANSPDHIRRLNISCSTVAQSIGDGR
jgi:hypothetical protein